jgi:CheY-like chemotaxis protein
MKRRLLLADDSVTIQRVIELTFADEDIDVVAVGDGDAALARLEADPPDIVLADVGMPGRDGYDIALHVHETPSLAHIPVVLLIGALQPLDERRTKESGCAGVLVKPFEPSLVIARVHELLNQKAAAQGDAPADGPALPALAPEPALAAAAHEVPPEDPARTPDEYFAQLDAAFAAFEGYGDAAPPESPGAQLLASQVPPPGEERAGADAAWSGAADEPSAPRGLTMADAFAALLALEQGQAPSRLPDDWPSPLTDVVEEIAQRVAEQITERVVRALAPEIVSRVSERIVREEIERLRQELASS